MVEGVSFEDVVNYLRSEGLIHVKLITFRLPSEYRGARTKLIRGDEGFVETRVLRDPIIFRRLRVRFYSVLQRVAYKTTAGWVLFKEGGLEELNEVIGEFNRVAGTDRVIWVIDVFLPRDYVVNQLRDYIRSKELSLERIKERIEERKREDELRRERKMVLKALLNKARELEELISDLKKELKQLTS